MTELNFDGRSVLITGAGSWIGQGIALEFANAGATVHLLGRNTNNINETALLLNEKAGKCMMHIANVKSDIDLMNVKCSIESLDILIHNAAIYPFAPIENLLKEEWSEVIETNLTSAFNLVNVFADMLKKSPSGKIIFISSIAGELLGTPNLTHYAASKAGMNGFMRSLAVELSQYKINVNSILPGNFINKSRFNIDDETYERMLEAIPLKMTGKPKDIAALCLFLASNYANFITGQTIVIDGGESIAPTFKG